jgi:eukaryotic-like serine/threonine-protein kinase
MTESADERRLAEESERSEMPTISEEPTSVPAGPKLLVNMGPNTEMPTIAEGPSSGRAAPRPQSSPDLRFRSESGSFGDAPNSAPALRLTLSGRLQQTGPASGSLSAGSLRFTNAATNQADFEVLRNEEAARASAFGRAIAILCLIGYAFEPIAPESSLKVPLYVTLTAMLGVSIWVWRRGKNAKSYTRNVFRIFAVACVLVAPFVVYYMGVFSPAPLLITLGFFIFGHSDDRKFMTTVAIVAISLYIINVLLIVNNLLPDAGLLKVSDAPPIIQFFFATYVPMVLTIIVWNTWASRDATLEAIHKAQEASRLAAQRLAQLDEANIHLDLALRAGAGIEGRFSGAMAGAYRLAAVIGRGAMGEIYAATHVDSGDRAAVKLLSLNSLESSTVIQRFLREGEIAMHLQSPHIVRVLNVGATREGAPYIAMELLIGNDLAFHLRQKKQLDLAETVKLAEQVARGLSVAHAASVVHRDIKPQNLFLTDQTDKPIWKILDFGVAKLQDSSGTLTQSAVVGTPGYMSPEQARGGDDVDLRSDIFSLGAVIYRSLTGRPPFAGADMPAILFEIVYKSPIRPSEATPGLPRDVDLVLAIALAKRRSDRFSSALEFAEAFRHAARGKLSTTLRERARTLVDEYPWGKPVVVERKAS